MTIMPTKRDVDPIQAIIDAVLSRGRTPPLQPASRLAVAPPQTGATNWDASPYPPLLKTPGKGGGYQPAPGYPDWAGDYEQPSVPITAPAAPNNATPARLSDLLLPSRSLDLMQGKDAIGARGEIQGPPAPGIYGDVTGEEPLPSPTAAASPRMQVTPGVGKRLADSDRPVYQEPDDDDPTANRPIPSRPQPGAPPPRNRAGEQRDRLKAGGIAAVIGALLTRGNLRGALAGFTGAARGRQASQEEEYKERQENANRDYQAQIARWQSEVDQIQDARTRQDRAEDRALRRYTVDTNSYDRRLQAQERADWQEEQADARVRVNEALLVERKASRYAFHDRTLSGLTRERAQNYIRSLAASSDPDDQAYAARYRKKADGTYDTDYLPSERDAQAMQYAAQQYAIASNPMNSPAVRQAALNEYNRVMKAQSVAVAPGTDARGMASQLTPAQKEQQRQADRRFDAEQKQLKIDNERKGKELDMKIAAHNSLLNERNLKQLEAEAKKGREGVERVNKELRVLDKDADDAQKDLTDAQGKINKLGSSARDAGYKAELARAYERARNAKTRAEATAEALRRRMGVRPGRGSYMSVPTQPTPAPATGGRLAPNPPASGTVLPVVVPPPGKPKSAVGVLKSLSGQ